MKKSLLFILLSLFCLEISAKTPALRFSSEIDWGYSAQVYSSRIFVYYPNSISYRVNDIYRGPSFYSNAYCNLGVGMDFLQYFSLHLKAGVQGIEDNFIITPLQLRFRYFPSGYDNNSHFVMAEGGAALRDLNFDDKCILLAAGGGYRVCLYNRICLDFCAKLKMMNCKPLPYDNIEGYIPRKQVVASDVTIILLSFGLEIAF